MISKTSTAFTGTIAIALSATSLAGWASSHREAPAITERPKIDSTDFYMFRGYEPGRRGTIVFIANYQPLQAPYGGPNYFTMDTDAIYEIHIDTNGDAREDVTFQFDFESELIANGSGASLPVGPAGQQIDVAIPLRNFGPIAANDTGNINELESYTIKYITGDRRTGTIRSVTKAGSNQTKFAKPIDNIGTKSIPDYAAYADSFVHDITIPGCANPGRVFVGQRAEAFAVNLGEVFDLINLVPIQGADSVDFPQYNAAAPFAGGITQDRANDDVVGKANVTSIAIEVPLACARGNSPVIGAWTTASLPQASLLDPSPTYDGTAAYGGAFVQQSRLSAPLVNEVVIGLKDKDLFNSAEPTIDAALADYVTHPTLPEIIESEFGGVAGLPTELAPNNFPRNDLVAAFLTGFPGLNQPNNVQASEMMRLNTDIPPTDLAQQNVFGVVAEDLAGFPNGRRPSDDTVDIALRVVMGALCHDLPLGAELGVPGAVEDTPSDFVNLGLCPGGAADAPVGNAALTDGAPLKPTELRETFPYLNTPLPGAGN